MAQQTIIPVFPCHSLPTTLAFYNAMGFETLYEQHRPYIYGSVKYQTIQIDFYGADTPQTAQESGHICLVITHEIGALHATFVQGLKNHFGKRMRSGIPRLGAINSVGKDQRFNLLDPDGNRLIVIEVDTGRKTKPKRATPLSKAISMARLDTYSRDAPEIAVEYFDEALQQLESEPFVTQFRAFVLRADIAAMLEDTATQQQYVHAAQSITLTHEERMQASEEIERLDELVAMSSGHT